MKSADLIEGAVYAVGRHRSQSLDSTDLEKAVLVSATPTAGKKYLLRFDDGSAQWTERRLPRDLLGTWPDHERALAESRRRSEEAEQATADRWTDLRRWQAEINVRLGILGVPERAGKVNPGKVSDGSAFRCVLFTESDLERLLHLAEIGVWHAQPEEKP